MAILTDDLKQYVDLPYAVDLVEEELADGRTWYVARHPELPGCMSDGATPEEARLHLDDARALYVRTLLEDGLPVPRPASPAAQAS